MELINPISYQKARIFYQMLTDRKTGGQTSISLRLEGITKKIFIKRKGNKERVRPGVVELGWGRESRRREITLSLDFLAFVFLTLFTCITLIKIRKC